jgi:phosphoribosylanthranilate isomerase
MRERDNIRAVAALKPDYMGFIFYEPSPRFVGKDFMLPDDFPKEIKRVGVFVNADTEEMLLQVKRLSLDYLQLHGNEPVEQLIELREAKVRLIKVFSVGDTFDFTKLNIYEPHVDYFLFDTKGKFHGGNAMAFDWDILAGYNLDKPFFLSGGLSPQNAGKTKMLEADHLHALDINSGVEDKPGVKNPALIRELLHEIEK